MAKNNGNGKGHVKLALGIFSAIIIVVVAILIFFGDHQSEAIGKVSETIVTVKETHKEDIKEYDVRIRKVENAVIVIPAQLKAIEQSVKHIAEDVKEIKERN